MSEYKTLGDKEVFEETEKRSKFISYVFPIDSEEDVRQNLKK